MIGWKERHDGGVQREEQEQQLTGEFHYVMACMTGVISYKQ